MKRTLILALCGALVLMVAMPAAAQTAADTYKAKCAMCHGADGKGDTMMGKKMELKPLGSDAVQKMSDADLKGVIENGKEGPKGKMVANKGKIADKDIAGLVTYIRSLKGK